MDKGPFFFIHADFEGKAQHIFDAKNREEEVPEGFYAVVISLDGRTNSDLDWKEALRAAERYRDQGLRLFWDLNLGLFSHLSHSLNDSTQHLSLMLAIEHFRNTVWKDFRDHTLGVSLYRGAIDFAAHFQWDDRHQKNLQGWLDEYYPSKEQIEPHHVQMFCRDVAIEYMEAFAQQLPDGLPAFALFDVSLTDDPLLLLQLLTSERFHRIQSAVTEGSLPICSLMRSQNSPRTISRKLVSNSNPSSISLGICLPSLNRFRVHFDIQLKKTLQNIVEQGIPYRFVSEASLTTEWDGLDHLVVFSNSVSSQGLRKLRGFCAAGGTVICIGDSLGLPLEIMGLAISSS